MSEAFASGHVIDAILALMVLEALVLGVVHNRIGRGMPVSQIVSTLASGAALMLALRAALTGARWETIAIFLVTGLVAHVLDLKVRWK